MGKGRVRGEAADGEEILGTQVGGAREATSRSKNALSCKGSEINEIQTVSSQFSSVPLQIPCRPLCARRSPHFSSLVSTLDQSTPHSRYCTRLRSISHFLVSIMRLEFCNSMSLVVPVRFP
ncbi:hypothetical protein AKJ16_DCAP22599 [Drosera capensis]